MAKPNRESQNVVRAGAIEIVDEKGNVRVKIGVFEEGPGIRIYDENDHTRAWLGMSFLDQPQLIFYDKTTTRMCLGLGSDGDPSLAMLDTMLAHSARSLWRRWDEENRQREERDRVRRLKREQANPPAKKSPQTRKAEV
jgi:hypothetical protein